MRKENSMPVLARRGVIQPGMKIEPMPNLLRGFKPPEGLQAEVVSTLGGKDSIRWRNELYSPNSLLEKFEHDFQIGSVKIVCRNWRIVGHAKSLRDEADQP